MKKTLLALAAIAASSASFAQSSVTLYGLLDVSLESVKGNQTVTRVTSGNLDTSRLGFKGTEDLGGGMKATFNLEAPVNVDIGAAASTFWDRQAWVGVGGGFGELRLGRTDTPIGAIAGNVLSALAYDDLKIVGTRAANDYRRASNAITYALPTLVPGLTATLQYSTGTGAPLAGEVAGSSEGKAYGLSVKYAAGPLSAGLGYENAKDEVAGGATSTKANATLVYAGYDFGAAKVTGYYNAETRPVVFVASGERRLTVLGAKVAVPFTPEFTLIAGLSTARNVEGSVAGDDNVQITTIKGVYNLSKRTSVYGMFTNVNNDTATGVGVLSATDGKTTRGIAAGIRHAF
ncbi:porin [Aquabacterium sp.]|uniref:porin n=1 Tax=Aquabacterium sp. TaxID=1872578 RepID=UPI0040378A16